MAPWGTHAIMKMVGLGSLDREISRQEAQRAQDRRYPGQRYGGRGGDHDPYDRPRVSPRVPPGRPTLGGMCDVIFTPCCTNVMRYSDTT